MQETAEKPPNQTYSCQSRRFAQPPLPALPPNKTKQNAVVTSPVTMWLDAIDMALSRLAALSNPPSSRGGDEPPATPGWGRSVLARVRALSVSGQQHGTVFWKKGARERLEGMRELGPRETLVEVRCVGAASAVHVVGAFFFVSIHRRKDLTPLPACPEQAPKEHEACKLACLWVHTCHCPPANVGLPDFRALRFLVWACCCPPPPLSLFLSLGLDPFGDSRRRPGLI